MARFMRHWRICMRVRSLLRALKDDRASGEMNWARSIPAARDLAQALGDAGGGYIKIAQVLSIRPDLLPVAVRQQLVGLCDHVPAHELDGLVANEELVSEIATRSADYRLLACGSIGRVYLVYLPESAQTVIFKVRRRNSCKLLRTDVALATHVSRLAALVPALRALPVKEGMAELGAAVLGQVDFTAEAAAQAYFFDALKENPDVVIPELRPALCSDDAIVMEYICDAKRIDDPDIHPEQRRKALISALRILFEMIFVHGWIHCDFHPGNLLVTSEGRLGLVDFGLMARLEQPRRDALAQIFLAVALADGTLAANAVLAEAENVPADIDSAKLECDLADAMQAVSGAPVHEFQVARFACSLFEIQRRHGIRGSAGLAMAITSLLSIEGLLKSFAADLDFQREALPYLLHARSPADGGDDERV
jgi:ubiquinone biosynthesis protein